MDKVVLYSTGCPRCAVLKRKLDEKKVPYELVTDEKIMTEKGISTVPVLEVKGEQLDFSAAIARINSVEA